MVKMKRIIIGQELFLFDLGEIIRTELTDKNHEMGFSTANGKLKNLYGVNQDSFGSVITNIIKNIEEKYEISLIKEKL
jgi:hypothetical protein